MGKIVFMNPGTQSSVSEHEKKERKHKRTTCNNKHAIKHTCACKAVI